jgi:hypothetical protein
VATVLEVNRAERVTHQVPVYEIDPQRDPRWIALVGKHPHSSVFHTPQWLEALHKTYGYSPKAFTTSPPGSALENGIVFSQIDSWLTGSRLVSLPFSDHCEPLVRNADDLQSVLSGMPARASGKPRYTEIRPRFLELAVDSGFRSHDGWYLHVLDLDRTVEELYERLHPSSVRRKIRRAEREKVVIEEGRTESLLKQFYELLILTRRRHRLVPQPFAWFRNLAESFGDLLTIRVARWDNLPIASILTLRHKQTVVYKYGCSDDRYHRLGAMPYLFWHAILDAKSQQLRELDLGRSEQAGAGLIRFKDELGATKTQLSYWRSYRNGSRAASKVLQSRVAQRFLSHFPDGLFQLAGRILYRHAG